MQLTQSILIPVRLVRNKIITIWVKGDVADSSEAEIGLHWNAAQMLGHLVARNQWLFVSHEYLFFPVDNLLFLDHRVVVVSSDHHVLLLRLLRLYNQSCVHKLLFRLFSRLLWAFTTLFFFCFNRRCALAKRLRYNAALVGILRLKH